jgi:hypothetical protein
VSAVLAVQVLQAVAEVAVLVEPVQRARLLLVVMAV